MLNLRGYQGGLILEVNGNSVGRKEEVTVYHLFILFFMAFFDSCYSFLTLTTLFWHLHIMLVIIRVRIRGHSLHLIGCSLEKPIRLFKFWPTLGSRR